MSFIKGWKHFITITHHRWLVRQGCFRVGLIWQGLTHDLSKYAPTEFLSGVRYFQGTRSPNTAERENKGYSESWMHHKGRNRHHYEYWSDLSLETRRYEYMPMPRKYLVEMVMDRRAACMHGLSREKLHPRFGAGILRKQPGADVYEPADVGGATLYSDHASGRGRGSHLPLPAKRCA